jgi:hypothetical protein
MASPSDPDPGSTITRSAPLSRGGLLVSVILVLLLLASLAGLAATFLVGRMPAISLHGWIAMGLGGVFSIILGSGLMWLSFYSARQGFDERADPGRKSTFGPKVLQQ